MTLEDHAVKFGQALGEACLGTIRRIPDIVGDECVYAFAIYTMDDFSSFCPAVATEESFARRPKNPGGLPPDILLMIEEDPDPELLAGIDLDKDESDYLRVTACEWEYIGMCPELFEPVDILTDELHEMAEELDDELDDNTLKTLFLDQTRLALKAIQTSQAPGKFSTDVLLTVQYCDIGSDEPDLLAIASEFNSEAWQTILQREWGGEK